MPSLEHIKDHKNNITRINKTEKTMVKTSMNGTNKQEHSIENISKHKLVCSSLWTIDTEQET